MLVDGEKLSEEIFKWYSQTESALTTAIWNNLNELIARCHLDIQPPVEDLERSRKARIEAAIRTLQEFEPAKPLTLKEVANLLRWVLGQDQDTWTDKDFGLEEEK